MNASLLCFGLPIFCLTLSGCSKSAALQGTPDFPTGALLPRDAAKMLQPVPPGALPEPPQDCINAINWEETNTNIDQLALARNNCIYSFIAAIDLQYYDYKRQTVSLIGDVNAAADIAVLGLTTAVTAFGAATTKTILGAIATGIGGTKSIISADVLYNASIAAIVLKMDADRNEQLSVILQRTQNASTPSASAVGQAGTSLGSGQIKGSSSAGPKLTQGKITKELTVSNPATGTVPPSTTTTKVTTTTSPPASANAPPQTGTTSPSMSYTMHEAAIDLAAYYEAGTFAHAIVSLQATAGAQATNCKAQVKNLKTTGTTTGSSTEPSLSIDTSNSSTTSANPAKPSAC